MVAKVIYIIKSLLNSLVHGIPVTRKTCSFQSSTIFGIVYKRQGN